MRAPAVLRPIAAAAAALVLAACLSGPPRQPEALQRAENLRVAALSLLVMAQDPPVEHESFVDDVEERLAAARDAARADPAQQRTVKAWDAMADPRGDLLGAFILKWRTADKGFPQAVLNAEGGRIRHAFDAIVEDLGGGGD